MALDATHEPNATEFETAVEVFRAGLRGELLRTGDAEYDRARQIWNGKTRYDPTNLFRLNQNIKPRG